MPLSFVIYVDGIAYCVETHYKISILELGSEDGWAKVKEKLRQLTNDRKESTVPNDF